MGKVTVTTGVAPQHAVTVDQLLGFDPNVSSGTRSMIDGGTDAAAGGSYAGMTGYFEPDCNVFKWNTGLVWMRQ